MKTLFVGLLLLLGWSPVFGQSGAAPSAPATADLNVRRDGKGGERLMTTKKPTGTVLKREVIYGGFFVDWNRDRQARRRALQSGEPVKKTGVARDNLSYYPNSEKPQGFVLFAVGF